MSGSAGFFTKFFFFTSSGAQRWAEREMGKKIKIRPPIYKVRYIRVYLTWKSMGLCSGLDNTSIYTMYS